MAIALGSAGIASAQTVNPKVALQFATNGLTQQLVASSTGATIARLMLDTTGSTEAIRVSSLLFNLIVGGGGIASTLTNCTVYNESTSATTGPAVNNLSSGVNQVVLNPSLVLNPNTTTTLALRCDIASNLVSGSTYTVNMNTSGVSATGVNSNLPATVSVRGSTVIPPPTYTPPVTPGLPTTGAPNEVVTNIMLLAASLSLATLGFSQIYLRRKQDSEDVSSTA